MTRNRHVRYKKKHVFRSDGLHLLVCHFHFVKNQVHKSFCGKRKEIDYRSCRLNTRLFNANISSIDSHQVYLAFSTARSLSMRLQPHPPPPRPCPHLHTIKKRWLPFICMLSKTSSRKIQATVLASKLPSTSTLTFCSKGFSPGKSLPPPPYL